MTPHEVLVAARNLIDREGWHQWKDNRWPGPGAYCAVGAISYSAAVLKVYDDLYEPARIALAEAVGVQHIAMWNDIPGRTKEEVLAAFDKAIAETAPEPIDPDDLPDPDGTNVLPIPSEFFAEARASFREPVKA